MPAHICYSNSLSIMSDMKYAIQVHPNANWHTSQQQARQLCDALLAEGAVIVAVFFYGQATQITALDVNHDWHGWDSDRSPLLVCSTLHEQQNNATEHHSMFTITGMSSWMQLSEQADQLVIIP